MQVRTKRIYEQPSQQDGYRVLVDGLWPRGVRKADAELDEWARDLAPSRALRTWFGHDPARWDEFRRRHFNELAKQDEAVRALVERAGGGRITLLYAAKDEEHNNAEVLKEYLEEVAS